MPTPDVDEECLQGRRRALGWGGRKGAPARGNSMCAGSREQEVSEEMRLMQVQLDSACGPIRGHIRAQDRTL